MKKNNIQGYGLMILLIPLLFGCASDSSNDEENNVDSLSEVMAVDTIDPNAFTLYTLPSPLQIATAIKIFNMGYYEELLNPTNQSTANFSTNYLKALNIGIFGVDMGYTTLYHKDQTAIYYMSIIQKLAKELDIMSGFDISTARDFKKNIDNQDSLTHIILSAFAKSHKYLQENDREDAGLLIITGSFLEGMYLIIGLSEGEYDTKIKHIVAMQKEYLANIIELLSRYSENSEISNLVKQLGEIRDIYNDISIDYSDSGEILKVNIKNSQIGGIKAKINTIRNDIVS